MRAFGSLTQVWSYSKMKLCTMRSGDITQSLKQAGRQTDRETDRHTHTHTNIHKGRRVWHCLVKSYKISIRKEDGFLRN